MTLRALEVLRSVPLIAAEDTRHTRRLLDRHAVATRATSYHAQSDASRTAALLEHLRGGADLALVTDAGTPAVSDPGADLVAAWAAEGGRVVPIPGASAVLAAVAASGRRRSALGVRGVPAAERARAPERLAPDRRRRPRHGRLRGARTGGGDPARPRGGVRRRATRRRLSRADQAARDDRPRLAGRARRGGRGRRRSRPAASSRWWSGRGRTAGRSRPRRETDALEAARAAVERLVAAGTARGEAARQVAAETGIARRQLYGADRVR